MPHYSISNTQDVTGLSLTAARGGEKVKIALKGFYTSNEAIFFDAASHLYDIFLGAFVQLEQCNRFLILRHEDKSADIYINDFETLANMMSKRKIDAGQLVRKEDIVDIKSIEFPSIVISKTDAIIFCMRFGWKFGLYFNFMANPVRNKDKITELDLAQINSDLAYVYRFLLFEKVYEIMKNDSVYPRMLSDGWFPFIELIEQDYNELSALYSNGWLDQIDDFPDRFDKSRIGNMTKSWYAKKQFNDKLDLIEAGISAFLEGSQSGYINSINTLYPQIEGIMGYEFYEEFGRKPNFKELKEYIHHKAERRFPDKASLGFPDYFYRYLEKNIFQDFDLTTGKIDLSRHSLTHGYAKPEDFTKAKATQALLVLNQLFFYL
jgi:hypothetical protein